MTKYSLAFLLTFLFKFANQYPSIENISPYLNGIFPQRTPGAVGAWYLKDFFPGLEFQSPLKVLHFPKSNDYVVLSKTGIVYRVSADKKEKSVILDISERTFSLGDGGSVGIAFHPDFGKKGYTDKNVVFLYYRTKPRPEVWDEKGYNRLSRFSWVEDEAKLDPQSEEILIQQYDRGVWHNGGGMFFGKDGFLYLAVGDEGPEKLQSISTQRIDQALMSGLLRIDIDNNPEKSHAIRRQPKSNATPPSGWPETFSRGYMIPNDNPWLDEEGQILEEFIALGIRSPYTMHLDRMTDKIWLTDVGLDKREEINIVDIEDNLEWPFREGSIVLADIEDSQNLIGNKNPPFFEYGRSFGTCIIGGGVYYGQNYPSLYKKYLFADYEQNKLAMIYSDPVNPGNKAEVLFGNLDFPGLSLPVKPMITGVHILKSDNIIISITGGEKGESGKILILKQRNIIPDPPPKLSNLGVFEDLKNLKPIPGILPYDVNTPLWSDGADKKRWIALPSNDLNEIQKIKYSEEAPWTFPEGTVFIKHFELEGNKTEDGKPLRLETRFLVVGKNKKTYGITYKWNEEGSEAYLLKDQDRRIFEEGKVKQEVISHWDFPGRDQCLSCHNSQAGYVLGITSEQLNRPVDFPAIGREINQLDYWQSHDLFRRKIEGISRLYSIEEKEVDLTLRIESYLQSNCANCHREDGIVNNSLDFDFNNEKRLIRYLNFPVESHASQQQNNLIEPGIPEESEIWLRVSSDSENKMPPIGRHKVDRKFVDSLFKWIKSLPVGNEKPQNISVFPNPTSGRILIRVPKNLNISALEVLNQDGKRIRYFQHLPGHVNLSNLQAALYFLVFYTDSGIKTKKVVLKN